MSLQLQILLMEREPLSQELLRQLLDCVTRASNSRSLVVGGQGVNLWSFIHNDGSSTYQDHNLDITSAIPWELVKEFNLENIYDIIQLKSSVSKMIQEEIELKEWIHEQKNYRAD